MHLSRVSVRRLRGAANGELDINLPGRVCASPGELGGKTTLADAIYLSHSRRFPQLPRHPAEALSAGDRDIEAEYRFAAAGLFAAARSAAADVLDALVADKTPLPTTSDWARFSALGASPMDTPCGSTRWSPPRTSN